MDPTLKLEDLYLSKKPWTPPALPNVPGEFEVVSDKRDKTAKIPGASTKCPPPAVLDVLDEIEVDTGK